MPKNFAKIFSFLFVSFIFPMTVFAWNSVGHMVVANIAYQNLTPDVKKKVDAIVANMTAEYPDITTFQQAAVWPDAIRAQRIEAFTHWHYVDNAISTDGSPLKDLIDTDNAGWAYRTAAVVVGNAKANAYERARFLAFVEHIAGDLHQPLHSVSNITAKNPNGDRGGNSTYVYYKNSHINLHKLWDGGVGEFDSNTSQKHIDDLTSKIVAEYPQSYFGDRASDTNEQDWINESVEVAKNDAYSTNENEPVSDDYINNGMQVADQQAAIAGYRLANTLNKILG